jgi:hypothetical protein
MNTNLLNSLLLSWNNILNNQISRKNISKHIQPIYLQDMESNPWYQQYKTFFEKSTNNESMHILASNVVNDSTSTTFLRMVLKLCMLLKKNLSLLFVMCINSQLPIYIMENSGKKNHNTIIHFMNNL